MSDATQHRRGELNAVFARALCSVLTAHGHQLLPDHSPTTAGTFFLLSSQCYETPLQSRQLSTANSLILKIHPLSSNVSRTSHILQMQPCYTASIFIGQWNGTSAFLVYTSFSPSLSTRISTNRLTAFSAPQISDYRTLFAQAAHILQDQRPTSAQNVIAAI